MRGSDVLDGLGVTADAHGVMRVDLVESPVRGGGARRWPDRDYLH
ncbi:hypothetical protein [Mycobacterium xenopi]|nr:hypothetical protein [Mycobacterium xenopi]